MDHFQSFSETAFFDVRIEEWCSRIFDSMLEINSVFVIRESFHGSPFATRGSLILFSAIVDPAGSFVDPKGRAKDKNNAP